MVVPPALKTYSSTRAFLAFPTASSDDDVREEAFDKDQVLFQATVHNQSLTDYNELTISTFINITISIFNVTMVTSSQTMMRMTCRLSEVWRRRKDCLGEADLIIDRYYLHCPMI